MSDSPEQTNPVLQTARRLSKRGVAVHWLRPRQKAPVLKKWATAPVATFAQLRETYRHGYNIGVRPGKFSQVGDLYLHLIDLDIRDASSAKPAWDALETVLPEARDLPMVVSGSGGESRHVYFFTEKPFKSKKLARSSTKSLGADGKPHDDWSVTLYGTGLQAALPPSIHPLTGKPYRWLREIDWSLLDLGVGPVVAADRVAAWGAAKTDSDARGEDDDDLLSLVRNRPLGLTEEEVDGILADLPHEEWCDDREGWLTVGMALHHEYQGSVEGFEKWCAFSQGSDKYDEADQERVWRSFHGQQNPVRMATLLKAVKEVRRDESYDFEAIAEDAAETSDIDELLGPDPSAAPTEDDDTEWRRLLDLTEEGALKNTVSNLSLIIQHDPRFQGCIEFNEFTQETVTRKPVRSKIAAMVHLPVRDTINGDLWQDQHDRNVRMLLESGRGKKKKGYGLKVTDRDLAAAIDIAARKQSFHPVRDYLSDLNWDGTPRIDRLFIDYLGAPDTAYSRAIARLTLLGPVVRAHEPGHKFDFVAILEGLQGKRKSTFIKILAKHWFAELSGDFHDRKSLVEQMQGAWILEIPELSGFSRSEVQIIKNFVSARSDKVRLSYARRAAEFERQCTFIGSTNESEYLRDVTGGRRFWPVHCSISEIDTERLSREIDQIWAEAVTVYREMRAKQPYGELPLFLTDRKAQVEALEMQDSRRIETPEDGLAGLISVKLDEAVSLSALIEQTPYFDNLDGDEDQRVIRNEVCLMEIWVDILGRDPDHWNLVNSQLYGRAMRLVPGWVFAGRKRHPKYGQQRTYRRIGSEGVFTPIE